MSTAGSAQAGQASMTQQLVKAMTAMQERIIQLKAATQGQEMNKGVRVNPLEEFKGDRRWLESYLLQY